jgi:hypothetical protein
MHKLVVVILGSFAVGKTSLARALVGDVTEHTTCVLHYDPDTHRYRAENVKYTVSEYSNIALPGSIAWGADSIGRIETLKIAVNFLLGFRDIVVADAFRCSMQFIEWLQEHPVPNLACLFVHIDIPLKINVARLKARRAAVGRDAELPARTYKDLLSLRSRAQRVFDYAKSSFLVIREDSTPDEAAKVVMRAVRKLVGSTGKQATKRRRTRNRVVQL